MPRNLDEWLLTECAVGHSHCTASADDLASLEQLGRTMSHIASLLGTDLAGLEVHGTAGRLRPIIGFDSPRLSLRILQNTDDWWVISVKILDGKPPGFPLVELIEDSVTELNHPVECDVLPKIWRHARRNRNPVDFTEAMPDEFWLHTFFYVLMRELAQY